MGCQVRHGGGGGERWHTRPRRGAIWSGRGSGGGYECAVGVVDEIERGEDEWGADAEGGAGERRER
jgi:hypothetical protein